MKTALQQKGLAGEGDTQPTPDSNRMLQMMEERLKEREELIASKGQTIEVLQKELSAKEQQCLHLDEENNMIKGALEELNHLKEQLINTQQTLAMKEQECNNLDEENKKTKDAINELNQLKEQLIRTQQELEMKEQHCFDLDEEGKRAKNALDELKHLKEQLDNTQQELAQVHEKHELEMNEKTAALQIQIKELQTSGQSQVSFVCEVLIVSAKYALLYSIVQKYIA